MPVSAAVLLTVIHLWMWLIQWATEAWKIWIANKCWCHLLSVFLIYLWSCVHVFRVCPVSPCQNVTGIMWKNMSLQTPPCFSLAHSHSLWLCVVLNGFPHSADLVLSGPVRGRICIDFQPPVPGALLLQGPSAPFLLCPPLVPCPKSATISQGNCRAVCSVVHLSPIVSV